ncbi:unnamed protein product, partial [Cuscuta europaea]
MSIKLHHQNLASSSSSSSPLRRKDFNRRLVVLDRLTFIRCYTRKRAYASISSPEKDHICLSHTLPDIMKHYINTHKSRKTKQHYSFASADDGVTLNERSNASVNADVEEMKLKLDLSIQTEENSSGLVQSIHDAARLIEHGIKQRSLSRSWFSFSWLGIDRTAWVKVLSYQASVYSLLQATNELSSRGDGRGNDITVFIQRCVLKQSSPLESVIRDELLAKQPAVYEWFWSEQIPTVVATFINYFGSNQHFTSATSVTQKSVSSSAGSTSDVSLLMLVLRSIAAIIKIGPTRVSCVQFFSLIPETLGRLMDILIENIPIKEAYHSLRRAGLHREFLLHFGSRAADWNVRNNQEGNDEPMFWVDLVQKQLERAIDRERIWSRLTTSESIEVLEKDLAIFGFFIALGRTTQSFVSANGFDSLDESIEELIRYLIGGSVLYYPQLSSISSYQLFVEVVCEELDWLLFYPGFSSNTKHKLEHKSKEQLLNPEAVLIVLDVCCYWIHNFIKYSRWLENPANIKAARYVSTMHDKLKKCMDELGIVKNQAGAYSRSGNDSDSFNKAMESVEEALVRLEGLLKQLHMSKSSSGEQLKAACSDLERIRILKKEAEFLEASFSAKAASLKKGDDATCSLSSSEEQRQYSTGKDIINANNQDTGSRGLGLWGFLVRGQNKALDSPSPALTGSDVGSVKEETLDAETVGSTTNEVQRFDLLRSELIELERRVKRSSDWNEFEEDIHMAAEGAQLVHYQKKESIIEKSLEKLKETSTDVWQGTQLLAIDAAAATELLRRSLIGDELTGKEKQVLRRTLTDLASVVPISFLMLLPVTAVGHAAMLAAIQRYVPALIPSTYGPE